MDILILAIVAFLFTRYIIPVLDVFQEYFNMIIARKMNNVNIDIAKNSREFEKSCDELDVELEEEGSQIGFEYPNKDEKESDEESEEEDEDDEWDEKDDFCGKKDL